MPGITGWLSVDLAAYLTCPPPPPLPLGGSLGSKPDPNHAPTPAAMLTPAQMAQTAEDVAYAKATGRPLKSFLLGLTAGGYIALGFVFFIISQVGAEDLPWGLARIIGGVVFATGLALVVLTGAE